jgi:replication factor C subunit 1
VAASISGKTDYLVIGYQLEDGREVKTGSKYRTAIEKNIPIITESEILSKIQSSNPNNTVVNWNAATSTSSSESLHISTSSQSSKIDHSSAKSVPIGSVQVKAESKLSVEESLWVEKYKPQRLEDVVGSTGILSIK